LLKVHYLQDSLTLNSIIRCLILHLILLPLVLSQLARAWHYSQSQLSYLFLSYLILNKLVPDYSYNPQFHFILVDNVFVNLSIIIP
jgi:hypothetical protein